MNAAREVDLAIARDVMGHTISQQKREVYEATPQGSRPLRRYSTDIAAAWEVAQKMAVSLIPIEDGSWFALAGQRGGWKSPGDFLRYLSAGEFAKAGAAVDQSAPLAICLAALRAVQSHGGAQGADEASA